MIEHQVLRDALVDHLPKQRWFGGNEADAASLQLTEVRELRSPWPGLLQALVEVPDHDRTATYQVILGLRPAETRDAFLEGKGDGILGELETELGTAVVYDATFDAELALCLLEHTAPGEQAERARPLGADQSNSSIVYDERLILKLFRRLGDGPNPDVEVTRALAETGFDAVPAPRGEWRRGDVHLAVAAEFLHGGVDGFQLALTSLRDLYDSRLTPAVAGGDFGHDAYRLGSITGRMHVALADAFGTTAADVETWADDMERQLARVDLGDVDAKAVSAVYEQLQDLDAGPAIRIHGDYHLGQVMRTDAGWYVLDFEGEPARPLEERRRPSSALRDVAGMLRSFHYAPEVGIREFGPEADAEVAALAESWEEHNRGRFLDGYLSAEGIEAVLPKSDAAYGLVLAAFELDKAVYEVGYEASHRPEWVGIPLSAVRRILKETASDDRIS